MNQVTNRVPYGLLSEAEQAQFCDEALNKGLYEVFHGDTWAPATTHHFPKAYAHRLIIKDDEWYWVDDGEIWAGAVLGESLRPEAIECYDTLRLAIPAEIQAAKPKELTLVEEVEAKYPDYEVVMLDWKARRLVFDRFHDNWCHVSALSMKGFYKYVYLCNNGELSLGHTPIAQFASYETVAVLFTKDSK